MSLMSIWNSLFAILYTIFRFISTNTNSAEFDAIQSNNKSMQLLFNTATPTQAKNDTISLFHSTLGWMHCVDSFDMIRLAPKCALNLVWLTQSQHEFIRMDWNVIRKYSSESSLHSKAAARILQHNCAKRIFQHEIGYVIDIDANRNIDFELLFYRNAMMSMCLQIEMLLRNVTWSRTNCSEKKIIIIIAWVANAVRCLWMENPFISPEQAIHSTIKLTVLYFSPSLAVASPFLCKQKLNTKFA